MPPEDASANSNTSRDGTRERAIPRFRGMKTVQKSSSIHAQVHNHFNQERHLVDRDVYKHRRSAALAEWRTLAA
jgi:putative transposase